MLGVSRRCYFVEPRPTAYPACVVGAIQKKDFRPGSNPIDERSMGGASC